jgi:hypothetical protein
VTQLKENIIEVRNQRVDTSPIQYSIVFEGIVNPLAGQTVDGI